MRIVILGRKKDTKNYEDLLQRFSLIPHTTLTPSAVTSADALLLPGGGDITPAFFGQRNNGSHHIDTELDILQFQGLEVALRRSIPILGICKGMQLINVALGGTLMQDMPTASNHRYLGKDQYHGTIIQENSCLYHLYGREAYVNSAHHQCVANLGSGLRAIQWCPEDHCIEAIVHENLPILGLQWHPERLQCQHTMIRGEAILELLCSWMEIFHALEHAHA